MTINAITVTCDNCGIDCSKASVHGSLASMGINATYSQVNYDLCPTCYEIILSTLTSTFNNLFKNFIIPS